MTNSDAAEQARRLHEHLLSTGALRSCINCYHRQGKRHESCLPDADNSFAVTCAKYNQTPPLYVVLSGCKAWTLDLPF